MTTEAEENYSITNSQENLKKLYWDGTLNHAFRHWFYLNKGIDIFNQFRYLFMLFFGLYYTMKLHNPWWLVFMTIVSIPILTYIGWLAVHRMARVFEYLNLQFSSLWGTYGVKLSESQISILQEIREELKKKNA